MESPDKRWARILAEYLGKFRIELPRFPLVLDVGCGNAAVWNYLGVAEYLKDKGLGMPHYIAVDKEEAAFQKAKSQLGELVTFLACDAQTLSDYVKGSFHLALCTHPDLTTSPQGPKMWQRVFTEVAGLLDPRGCLVVTSFWVQDHIPLQVAVDRAGLRILYSGTNRFPGRIFDRASDGEPLQYDKYILLARKLSGPEG